MIVADRSEMSVKESVLYVGFELGQREWKLAMTTGFGVKPVVQRVSGGDVAAVQRIIAKAHQRFGLGAGTRVASCYEAGRDGFWVHRALTAVGVDNRVVDSSSIEVNRRRRRAKTDRLDALKLVMMLVRVWSGEAGVWREVRVPTVAAEAARSVSRERTALTQDRTRLVNQQRGWLATWGARLPGRRREGWWNDGAGLGGRGVAGGRASAPRAGGSSATGDQGADRRARCSTGRHTPAGSPGESGTTAGPVEGRGGPQRVGPARGRARVARVSESPRDWRTAGVCAHAVQQRRPATGSGDQPCGECASASGEHSARVELGAVAALQSPHSLVPGALWRRATGAPHRDCGARSQTPDRALAVCHRWRHSRGRALGSRVGRR